MDEIYNQPRFKAGDLVAWVYSGFTKSKEPEIGDYCALFIILECIEPGTDIYDAIPLWSASEHLYKRTSKGFSFTRYDKLIIGSEQ